MCKIKACFYFIFLSMFLINCKQSEIKVNKKKANFKESIVDNDTLKFKKWLRDTIIIFNKDKAEKDSKYSEMKVYDDSTSVEFCKKYNLEIKLSENGKIRNKDVDFILTLLKYYKNFPEKDFVLDFEILDYYDVSKINEIYEHNYEITYLNVMYDKKKYSYNFMKGNLIDKKIEDLK
jgi:hypothetical protein